MLEYRLVNSLIVCTYNSPVLYYLKFLKLICDENHM